MSQPRKTITLYLLTNDEKQTRKMTVPVSYFKLGLFFIAFALVTLFAGFIDYFGLLAQSVENRKLKIENVTLEHPVAPGAAECVLEAIYQGEITIPKSIAEVVMG